MIYLLVIILAVYVYILWSKIKQLQNYLKLTKVTPVLSVMLTSDIFTIPLVAKAIGLESAGGKELKDVPESDMGKIREYSQKNPYKFFFTINFICDKLMVFCSRKNYSSFGPMPELNGYLYTDTLAENGNAMVFLNIILRQIPDLGNGKPGLAYVGYVSEHKTDFLSKEKEAIFELFTIPASILTPAAGLDLNLYNEQEQLLAKLGLKREDNSPDPLFYSGDETDEFGDKIIDTGSFWYINKYCQIKIDYFGTD